MFFTSSLAAVTASYLISSSIAAPVSTTTAQEDTEPCTQVVALIAEQDSTPYIIPSDLALACLQSVPLDEDRDALLLGSIRSLFEYQSTTAYLKNPPPGSFYPPVDLIAGLDDIEEKFYAGYYTNEYDLQYDLYSLVATAHDFHFNYDVDIVSGIFTWARGDSLMSISTDGISLPDLYLGTDLAMIMGVGNASYDPSVVSTIDGVDAETWVNAYAELTPYGHDPDTNYNSVLLNFVRIGSSPGQSPGTFAQSTRPLANDTLITFENGTEKHVRTFAATTKDFSNVTDAASFLEQLQMGFREVEDTPKNTTAASNATSTLVEPDTTFAPFEAIPTQTDVKPLTKWFGTPLVSSPDHSIAGFLPEELEDTAVLQIPTFEPAAEYIISFQNVVRETLATAYAQNRTKLIVDVRGNGGGYVLLGYDTFIQIFPDILPYGATQVRSGQLFRDTVQVLNAQLAGNDSMAALTDQNFYLDPVTKIDGEPFESVDQYLGPYLWNDDVFTDLQRLDLSNGDITSPIIVSGFANNTEPIPQVFSPENIVILTDGFCGSTCAVFTEFMKTQGNVSSIAVGGRSQEGPMQGVGGSKGGQVLQSNDVITPVYDALSYANSTANATLAPNSEALLAGSDILLQRTLQGNASRINYRNNIREHDETMTPLQFVYEATACRFFYTASMLEKQTEVWEMVYDLAWNDRDCVVGSTGHPSAEVGNIVDYILDPFPEEADIYADGALPENTYPAVYEVTVSNDEAIVEALLETNEDDCKNTTKDHTDTVGAFVFSGLN